MTQEYAQTAGVTLSKTGNLLALFQCLAESVSVTIAVVAALSTADG
jgi:hypothetical protein